MSDVIKDVLTLLTGVLNKVTGEAVIVPKHCVILILATSMVSLCYLCPPKKDRRSQTNCYLFPIIALQGP